MKVKLIALIIMISFTGIVAARNSRNLNRKHTCSTCILNNSYSTGSQLHLKKAVGNKRTVNKRWQRSETAKKQNTTYCRYPEADKTK